MAVSTPAHAGINAVFHYVPLHSSPCGEKYGKVHGGLAVTNSISARLIRLPLWIGLGEAQQDKMVRILAQALQA